MLTATADARCLCSHCLRSEVTDWCAVQAVLLAVGLASITEPESDHAPVLLGWELTYCMEDMDTSGSVQLQQDTPDQRMAQVLDMVGKSDLVCAQWSMIIVI
jgi:hypothetical protein